jgi:hypothetical protein
MNNQERYYKLLAQAKKRNPNLEIRYKDESPFMRLIGKILFFNKSFMSRYTTTIGTTIYFPKRKEVEERPEDYFYILAHECVHAWDYLNHPILFPVAYLLPQLLAFLSLGAFLAFVNSWFLLCLLFLVFLAPIPSIGRARAEIRGYGMTCKVKKWIEGDVSDEYLNKITKSFTGSSYYFMWPFKSYVKKRLKKYIETNDCLKDRSPVYRDVYKIVR